MERFLLHKLNWKFKSPAKVKAFVWTTVFNRINTNDMLQKHRPIISLSQNMRIMCGLDSKSRAHLFLHCPIEIFGTSFFLNLCGPMNLHQFLLTEFRGFGSRKKAKSYNSPWFLLFLGVSSWKEMLEFSVIPFQLLIYLG